MDIALNFAFVGVNAGYGDDKITSAEAAKQVGEILEGVTTYPGVVLYQHESCPDGGEPIGVAVSTDGIDFEKYDLARIKLSQSTLPVVTPITDLVGVEGGNTVSILARANGRFGSVAEVAAEWQPQIMQNGKLACAIFETGDGIYLHFAAVPKRVPEAERADWAKEITSILRNADIAAGAEVYPCTYHSFRHNVQHLATVLNQGQVDQMGGNLDRDRNTP